MKQWKYIVYVFIVLVCPMQAFAQTKPLRCDSINVHSAIKSHRVTDKVWHVLKDTTISFSFTLSLEDSLKSIYRIEDVEPKVYKGDMSCEIKEQEISDTSVVFSCDVVESGNYRLKLKKIALDSINGSNITYQDVDIDDFDDFEVKLYNAPIQVRDREAIEIKLKGDSWKPSWADGSKITMEESKVGDGFFKFSYILSEGEIKWKQDSIEKEVCEKELIFENDKNGDVTEEFKVRIYKKPLRPDSLKRKGNGNSKIYIASSPFKDGYIFGDGDNSEDCDTICEDATGTRKNYYHAFYRYENKPKDAWVSTYWVYDGKFDYEYDYGNWEIPEEIDGSKVYCESERLKFNSAKSAPSRALRVEKGHFSVNLEEEASAVVTLYRLDGKIVKEQHYAPQIDFDEKLDFDGVASGMYIIKCTVGEQQVVRKIVVR